MGSDFNIHITDEESSPEISENILEKIPRDRLTLLSHIDEIRDSIGPIDTGIFELVRKMRENED